MASDNEKKPPLSFTQIYLLFYNFASCLTWARVLAHAIPNVVTAVSTSSSSPWTALVGALAALGDAEGTMEFLSQAQFPALLEILHAQFDLVRSPVFVTTLQVGSRIAAMVGYLYSPMARSQWGCGLMIISWSLVEVPRYAFYVCALVTGDATKKTPYPLFWLRYSLFAILYPTGITGELTVFLAAAKDPAFLTLWGPSCETLLYCFIMSFPVIYVPGALPMIMNMAGNRKSAFKKRFAKPPPPPRGIVFPLDDHGTRSSTLPGKQILAGAAQAVSPGLFLKIMEEKRWRFRYIKYFLELVERQCLSSRGAFETSRAGLRRAHEIFQFANPDGSVVSLKTAMKAHNTDGFHTGFVQGTGATPAVKEIAVPYKGRTIKGQELKDQVRKWVAYGTIEPSAGEAICKAVDTPAWVENIKDRYFVLLGAGSAMGPFEVLLSMGANIVAIDLDRPHIWQRLIAKTRASAGSITFPLKSPVTKSGASDEELAAGAGCNLFTETPLIRDWLMNLYPGKSMCVGSYAYLNGAAHVQVSIAMDAICQDLSENRPNTALAYLCTPTDLHLIPKEAWDASQENYKEYSKKIYCFLLHLLSNGKYLRKNARKPIENDDKALFYVVNGLSVAQGPNYALAKRLQHWRAITARKHGCIVSSNIAPATSTVSVVHNRQFAWAYEGMPYFRPYEIFAPSTSNAVMTALLLFDLNDESSAANPKRELDNPNCLFSFGSFNGGAWRCAYEVDSIGEASVFVYFGRVIKPYLLGVGVVGGAVAIKFLGFF